MRSGLLFVWHDHEGNPPDPAVRIPEIPEAASDEWDRLAVWNRTHRSNRRDIIDNVTDGALLLTSNFGFAGRTFKNVSRATSPSQYLHAGLMSTIWGTSYGEAHLDSSASYFAAIHDQLAAQLLRQPQVRAILINRYHPVTQNLVRLCNGRHRRKAQGYERRDDRQVVAGSSLRAPARASCKGCRSGKHKTCTAVGAKRTAPCISCAAGMNRSST